MSVRGIMTSRTIVSPRANTDSMRSFSSSSMAAPAAAASVIAISSSSEITGAPAGPGRMTFATALRKPVSARSGATRRSARSMRADAQAARSRCWSAQIRGMASARM